MCGDEQQQPAENYAEKLATNVEYDFGEFDPKRANEHMHE